MKLRPKPCILFTDPRHAAALRARREAPAPGWWARLLHIFNV